MKWDWYFYKNLYTKEECAEIYNICKDTSSKVFEDAPANGKDLTATVIDRNQFGNHLDKFFSMVEEANEDVFGFDLYPNSPRSVNLNVYNLFKRYDYHKDAAIKGSTRDVKLTAILNISQTQYSGGQFEIFDGYDATVEEINECGSLLIFPSFLYHRVMPVTEGQRITLSAWFSGPNWK
jgi:PKHD-type hydroxylase